MASLLKLRIYLKPHFWMILASAALAIPLSALRSAPAPMVQRLIDSLEHKDASRLALFPLLFIALYLINFVVRFFHYYLLRIVVVRVNEKIRNDLYEHVMGLSADYFTQQSTGSLISRVGLDPQHIDGGLSSINVMIREPITFLMLFGYTLYLNWRLTLITLLIFPPLAWVFRVSGKNLKRYTSKIQEENARLYSTLQESFTGIRVVKTFNLQGYLRTRFFGQNASFARLLLKSSVVEEASHPMVELITAFAVSGVIYYGGSQVIQGRMTSGELFAFFLAFGMMLNPIRMMNDISIKLHTASAAADRVMDLLSWKPRLFEAPHPKQISQFKESIRFDQVRFAYPDAPEREVLKGITFEVKRGKAVAIVGASGAGKSSLVSLLPRIFDVTGGAIRIDAHDIKDFSLGDLRSQIAVVSQDVFLFNDTVAENIRCGRLDATDEEVREAARKAHALDFIEKTAQGFATVIGDRGMKLSGGERQRLSIARAFLREAPILILDEATSSLDTASERHVQAALDELMKNRTAIVIAHRLSTIRHADEIVVIREGQIVETGNHEALLAKNGEYARFHRMHESGTAV